VFVLQAIFMRICEVPKYLNVFLLMLFELYGKSLLPVWNRNAGGCRSERLSWRVCYWKVGDRLF
jgi:hypothetical protein